MARLHVAINGIPGLNFFAVRDTEMICKSSPMRDDTSIAAGDYPRVCMYVGVSSFKLQETSV